MMTYTEREAFRINPGPPGLYQFEDVYGGHRPLFRKWTGEQWHCGTTIGLSFTEARAKQVALIAQNPIKDFSVFYETLEEGHLPIYICDLNGVPVPAEGALPEPVQFDLFQ